MQGSMETRFSEIDEGTGYVGYREGFDLVCSDIQPLGAEEIALEESANRVAAEDMPPW